MLMHHRIGVGPIQTNHGDNMIMGVKQVRKKGKKF